MCRRIKGSPKALTLFHWAKAMAFKTPCNGAFGELEEGMLVGVIDANGPFEVGLDMALANLFALCCSCREEGGALAPIGPAGFIS